MQTICQDQASQALCEFGSCRLQGRFGLGAEIRPDPFRETAPATGNGLVGRLGGERAVIVLERQRAGRPANENTGLM